MNSATNVPAQKLQAGGYAAAVATVVMYLLSRYAGFDPPPDVAVALGALISGVVFFAVGYFTPPNQRDMPVVLMVPPSPPDFIPPPPPPFTPPPTP